MPRLAANLTMMFTEVPFLERFKAAAEVGFSAVEFLFPYDVPLEDIAVQLAGTGLAVALFNMPPCRTATTPSGHRSTRRCAMRVYLKRPSCI